MFASELQISLPTVNRRTPAVVAARLIARTRVGVLVFADDDGAPAAIVSASDVLRALLRAGETDGEGSEPTVGDLLDDDQAVVGPIVHVEPTAPLTDVAIRMAAARAHVAVVDGDPRSPRFILLPLVLDAVLAARADGDVVG